MENGTTTLQALTTEITAYLSKLSYSDSSLTQFQSTWRKVEEFMNSESIKIYSPAVGDSFICHLIGEREYKGLNRREKAIIQYTNMLTEFIENRSIKFSRGKQFLTLRGPIGKRALDFIGFKKTLGISNETIGQYKHCLQSFVKYLDETGVTSICSLGKFYVLDFASQLGFCSGYKRHRTLGILRNFLRYLYDEELTAEDLSRAIPKTRYVRQPALPSSYSQKEIADMLDAVDRANPKGKRDYAMLLVTARLGLRASDVCELKFEHIQWEKNAIVLNQQKTGKRIELPLLPEIGEGIIDYLKYGRPKSALPYVFLQANHPYDRLNRTTLHSIVCYYLRRAGIDFKQKRKHGPHALRHSLAGVLLEKKTPVPVISEVLGHGSTESTRFYLRIDINSLRQCVLEVPSVPNSFYNEGGAR